MPIFGYLYGLSWIFYLCDLNVKYDLELKGQQIINMEDFLAIFPKLREYLESLASVGSLLSKMRLEI